MRVFYCRGCKKYQEIARVKFYCELTCSAIVSDNVAKPYIEDVDTYIYGLEFKKHEEFFECQECGKEDVVIVDVDTCPHVWEISGDVRKCRICTTTQKGQVSFS